MSMQIAFDRCVITSVTPSKQDDSTYVNISSVDGNGSSSTSVFNFRVLGVDRSLILSLALTPIRMSGTVVGRIYGKDQKLTISNCKIAKLGSEKSD